MSSITFLMKKGAEVKGVQVENSQQKVQKLCALPLRDHLINIGLCQPLCLRGSAAVVLSIDIVVRLVHPIILQRQKQKTTKRSEKTWKNVADGSGSL